MKRKADHEIFCSNPVRADQPLPYCSTHLILLGYKEAKRKSGQPVPSNAAAVLVDPNTEQQLTNGALSNSLTGAWPEEGKPSLLDQWQQQQQLSPTIVTPQGTFHQANADASHWSARPPVNGGEQTQLANSYPQLAQKLLTPQQRPDNAPHLPTTSPQMAGMQQQTRFASPSMAVQPPPHATPVHMQQQPRFALQQQQPHQAIVRQVS